MDTWIARLKSPSDSVSSFHDAIESAREVENKGVRALLKVAKRLGALRMLESDTKFRLSLQIREALASPDLEDLPVKERRDRVDMMLAEDIHEFDKLRDFHKKMLLFHDCIKRVIATANHHRADIAKRIKVLEVESDLLER